MVEADNSSVSGAVGLEEVRSTTGAGGGTGLGLIGWSFVFMSLEMLMPVISLLRRSAGGTAGKTCRCCQSGREGRNGESRSSFNERGSNIVKDSARDALLIRHAISIARNAEGVA